MENLNVRRSFLLVLAATLLGCNSEAATKPPFGTELSVAEQVALEAAFGKVADSLDRVRHTPDDSIVADFTRIAARLVRLEGRYGVINVQLPGSATATEMRAVAVTSSDPTSSAKLVLAWEGLDVATFTMAHAFVIQSGGFASTLAAQMRYLDMSGAAATQGIYSGGGLLTFSAPNFTNNCEGLKNTSEQTCRAGKLTASGQADVTKAGAATSTSISFTATPIAAFEVTVQ